MLSYVFDCHESRGQQILDKKDDMWLTPLGFEIYDLDHGKYIRVYIYIHALYSIPMHHDLHYDPWILATTKSMKKNICFKSHLCIIAMGLRRSQTDVSSPRLLRFRCEDQRAALKIADKLKNLDPKFQEPSTEGGLDVTRCKCQVWVLDVGAI